MSACVRLTCWTISEAEVFVTAFPDPVTEETNYCRMCVADAQIFMGITFDLLFRPNTEAEERRTKALQTLDTFYADKGELIMINTDKDQAGNTSILICYYLTLAGRGRKLDQLIYPLSVGYPGVRRITVNHALTENHRKPLKNHIYRGIIPS